MVNVLTPSVKSAIVRKLPMPSSCWPAPLTETVTPEESTTLPITIIVLSAVYGVRAGEIKFTSGCRVSLKSAREDESRWPRASEAIRQNSFRPSVIGILKLNEPLALTVFAEPFAVNVTLDAPVIWPEI